MVLNTSIISIVGLCISILGFFGFGTFFAYFWKKTLDKKEQEQEEAKNNEKKFENEFILLKEGLQALLRTQLIASYNKGIKDGYAHIYEKENFENCYKKYHSLGANGVMDSLKEEYMALPTINNKKEE